MHFPESGASISCGVHSVPNSSWPAWRPACCWPAAPALRGVSSSPPTSLTRASRRLTVAGLSADAMVVIRYPAFVDEAAEAAYFRLFEQHAIGGAARPDAASSQEVDRLALSVIAKSNYFSMSLYRELQRQTAGPFRAAVAAYHRARRRAADQPALAGFGRSSQRRHHRFQCLHLSGSGQDDGFGAPDLR